MSHIYTAIISASDGHTDTSDMLHVMFLTSSKGIRPEWHILFALQIIRFIVSQYEIQMCLNLLDNFDTYASQNLIFVSVYIDRNHNRPEFLFLPLNVVMSSKRMQIHWWTIELLLVCLHSYPKTKSQMT